VDGQDNIDPFQARTAKRRRLHAEARNPRAARVCRREGDALIVGPFEPQVDILRGDRRAFQKGRSGVARPAGALVQRA
jgi:hypothetical protein